MKSIQRYDLRRLAEQLVERGLIEPNALQHAVQQCHANGWLLTELLVQDGLVSDWEISRLSCELFHLPFLPVERYAPQAPAREGLDASYLRRYCLVPLDRWGSLLTVAMPGVVATEVLEALRGTATRVMPVVGSVLGNRKWLKENLPDMQAPKAPVPAAKGPAKLAGTAPGKPGSRPHLELVKKPPPSLPTPAVAEDDGDWADIFDVGDQSVHQDLKLRQDPGARS